jgi:23S rRNA (cytidine1920-2'-O)/16S rRNA (cytidine1409-2'-O)-methyltransferase
MKRRLDILLVERGLARSRQSAQSLIMSGRVEVEGARVDKPGAQIADGAGVRLIGPEIPYVGRGGLKLAGALDAFGIDVAGLIAVDIGSSTGGFTDCLLQRGAARVCCVDVGRGQLDWTLRNDPRVVVIEGLNARYLSPADLPAVAGAPQLAVVDVSFISLRLVLPRVPPLLAGQGSARPGGDILALVKPQFEVGRGRVGRGGIVRDAALRREVLSGIASFAGSLGLGIRGMCRSPIQGAEGNREYFLYMNCRPSGLTSEEIEQHAVNLTNEEASRD